ncbi:hypothetical protein J5I95_18170 [Candidatus Poribacteria bacterium]|nr:hypothetical protein [Candidatus Poribacteria bacterium]
MRYDTECKEAAERIFTRVHGHLLSIRDGFGKLEAIDCAIVDENNALLTALEVGDPMEVESDLYEIDHEDEEDNE